VKIPATDFPPFIIVDGLRTDKDAGHIFPTVDTTEITHSPVWFVIGSPRCHEPSATGHRRGLPNLSRLYFPLWKEEEFNTLLRICYNMNDIQDFSEFVDAHDIMLRKLKILPNLKRTQVFGFNPRNVLFPWPAIQNLSDALSDRDFVRKAFASSSEIKAGPTAACHRLVVLEPSKQLNFATPLPATEFIMDRVCEVLGREGLASLRKMVGKVMEMGNQKTAGNLYETLCHRIFSEKPDTVFWIQELGSDGKARGNPQKFFMEAWLAGAEKFNVMEFAQLSMDERRYYEPIGQTELPCLDSVALTQWTLLRRGEGGEFDIINRFRGMVGFQMTISLCHPVAEGPKAKETFLRFVEKAFGHEIQNEAAPEWERSDPCYIFVVPEGNMKTFQAIFPTRQYLNGNLIDPTFHAALEKVRFFVMEVPVREKRVHMPDKAAFGPSGSETV
jgi:hypothetical protein